MKFTCEKSTLMREISIAQEIISVKNVLSILSNVLLEADNDTLTIRATDLKVNFETKIPVNVINPGCTTVFCDKFLGIIRSLPESDIDFTLSDDTLLINPVETKINFKLKCINPDKYPENHQMDDSEFFNFSQKDFLEMVTQTIFSISDDETRYFMNGVYFENNENKKVMVATDGRRLSFISKEMDMDSHNFEGVIVPAKILNLYRKLSSGEGFVYIAIHNKTLYLKFDNLRISSNLIDGQFPNYNRVIPEVQIHQIVINRKEFLSALKRVSILAEMKSKRIYLSIAKGNIILHSEESDIGQANEIIPCQFDEEINISMALNYVYIEEPLKVILEEEIEINFSESNKAITLNCHPKKDYFHIIMPMQMD